MRYWLVMPAAGSGSRSGLALPKQYAQVAGRSVIEWSLQPFLDDPRCQGLMVALALDDAHFAKLAFTSATTRLRQCTGGARRCDSVLAALRALPAAAADWVLVHDAARPCVTTAEVDALIAAASEHAAGGLLALPLADTLKRDDGGGAVLNTLARDGLWRALTPQMFRYGPLCAALERAVRSGMHPTDEAQALEDNGLRPLLVAGSPQNIKITSSHDLALAARILESRRSES